ncbi:MAG: SIS domain-containing protein [Candidatus Heimdallarchaeota archaeon]|nr:SIS domain-containing protein [Candidatus Heimdallarchaeota archaeon]MCK4770697.1 SIS domain-containing protein [Candidatus Heimdallarchaeota archaeon]
MGLNKKEEKGEKKDQEVIDSESVKYLTSDTTKPVIFKALELMVKNLQENIDHMGEHYEYVQQIRDRLMEDIRLKKRIYILASGRSAMVGQMLQTRLEHFGVESRFITNTRSVPRLKEEDTIIVISGSGTTPIVKAMLETYLIYNPFVIVLTSYVHSLIGRLGNVTIKLKGRTKSDLERRDLGLDSTLAPEGTAFEHAALAFLDGVVAELAVSLHEDEESLLNQHNQGL